MRVQDRSPPKQEAINADNMKTEIKFFNQKNNQK